MSNRQSPFTISIGSMKKALPLFILIMGFTGALSQTNLQEDKRRALAGIKSELLWNYVDTALSRQMVDSINHFAETKYFEDTSLNFDELLCAPN